MHMPLWANLYIAQDNSTCVHPPEPGAKLSAPAWGGSYMGSKPRCYASHDMGPKAQPDACDYKKPFSTAVHTHAHTYMCMHIYMCDNKKPFSTAVHTHAHTHAHTHVHTHVYTHTSRGCSLGGGTLTCTYTCAYAYTYAYVYTCAYTYYKRPFSRRRWYQA